MPRAYSLHSELSRRVFARLGLGSRLSLVARLTVAAGLLAGCDEPPVAEDVVRPVRYQRVSVGGENERRVFSGTAEAALDAELSFKVPGNVVAIDVAVGDVIEAGDLVGRLDPTDYDVQLRESEARLERARAELRNANADFQRTRQLYENRNASKSDLDNSRASAEAARAQVRAAQQQLEAARLQRSYTELRAPEVCTVAAIYIDENQNVTSGQGIVRVNCGDCTEVKVDVPGVFIGLIERGMQASVEIPALRPRQFEGVVSEVGIATDRASTTYPVTLEIQGDCAQIRSGMAAEVAMSLAGIGTDGIVIPFVAVGEDSAGHFVFVLEPENDDRWVASRRSVEVAAAPTSQGMPIVSGLQEGELIATAGVRRLVDGQIVRLLVD